MMNLIWLAFITGLTTGALSCLAVQGGLLASTIASGKNKFQSIFLFLSAKTFSYTLLGIALGTLGSFFVLKPNVQGVIQIIAGLFMLLTAAQLLKLHPSLRFLVIHPPKWVYKLTVKQSEKDSSLTPLVLGFLTVLIPCGTTQAMMALSISSGNPFTGAAILFAFTLGTVPIFLLLGTMSVALLKKKAFAYFAAVCIAYLGLLSINTGQILRGSFYTFQNFYTAATTDIYDPANKVLGAKAVLPQINNGRQEVTINVTNDGYQASANILKVGVPVRLVLSSQNAVNCSRSFVIPSQNFAKVLPENGTEVIEFTPSKSGPLSYSCSMGMFNGQFTVIN